MLGIENVDVNRQFQSAEEEVTYIRRYIFQLYMELDYRLEELERQIKELENEKG